MSASGWATHRTAVDSHDSQPPHGDRHRRAHKPFSLQGTLDGYDVREINVQEAVKLLRRRGHR
jgi:hypothetical protein